MSIQPSLSKSRKAQPAPVDSGRYFCDDFPLVWTKAMPESAGRISEKGNLGLALSAAKRNRGSLAAAAEPAKRRRKSRRRWRSGRMELFGVRRTWLGDADPVIGEGGMQIGGPDFWHVATRAVSYGYGAGS